MPIQCPQCQSENVQDLGPGARIGRSCRCVDCRFPFCAVPEEAEESPAENDVTQTKAKKKK